MDFEDAPAVVKIGRWLFQHRSYQFIALLPVLSLWGETGADLLTWSLGLILGLVGGLLRLWCIGHIGRSARTRKDKAKKLITTGPFALCRNPIYLANILAVSGFVIVCETVWYLPVYLIFAFSFYSLIVRYEEYLLHKKFGESYKQYKQSTPRWIPYPTGQSIGFPSYNLSEVLYREKSMFWVALGLFIIAVSKEFLPAVI